MELSRYEIAAVKKTAQIVKPKRTKLAKLIAKRDDLNAEIKNLQAEIDLWEAPIITKHGYSSEQILSGEADKIASQTENMEAVESKDVDMQETFVGYSQPDYETAPDNGTFTTSINVDEDPFIEPEF